MIRIGLFHSTIRGDEKLLKQAAERDNSIDLDLVDARSVVFNPNKFSRKYDVVLERCVSTTIGMHVITFFQSQEIPVINSMSVAMLCIDKFATSLALAKKNIPTVSFALAFSEKQAKEAVSQLGGYPVVVKPAVGSWGRLLAKVNDDDALEAVIEQKKVLGTPPHKAFYIQKYVEKNGKDIRVTSIDGKVLCAIYRQTDHWITNTARGAKATTCQVTDDLEMISKKASDVVGGGVLGIDVFETDSGYLINEVNHTTEFKNVQKATGVDIAGQILLHAKKVSKK